MSSESLENRLRKEAIAWTDEINIQSDAIVSKTLVDQKTGTITVFAFDDGQALSEHTAPFDAFVHIVSGEMNITLAGKEIRVKESQSLIMPANVPHALAANGPTRMLLVMIKSI